MVAQVLVRKLTTLELGGGGGLAEPDALAVVVLALGGKRPGLLLGEVGQDVSARRAGRGRSCCDRRCRDWRSRYKWRGRCGRGRPGRAAAPCPGDDCGAVSSGHHVLHRPGRLPPRAGRHRHQRGRAVGPPARLGKRIRKPRDRPHRQRSRRDRHTPRRLGNISICF